MLTKIRLGGALALACVALPGCKLANDPDLPPIATCWTPEVKEQAKSLAETMMLNSFHDLLAVEDKQHGQRVPSKDEIRQYLTVKAGDFFTTDRSATAMSATCGLTLDVQVKNNAGEVKSSTGNIISFSVYQGETGQSVTMGSVDSTKILLGLGLFD